MSLRYFVHNGTKILESNESGEWQEIPTVQAAPGEIRHFPLTPPKQWSIDIALCHSERWGAMVTPLPHSGCPHVQARVTIDFGDGWARIRPSPVIPLGDA